MSGQIFRHTHRVTYAECTCGNHVYYARYLDILEESRGEFFRFLGVPLSSWQTVGAVFPVVEARLQFKSPARYDDLLSVELWLTQLRGIRLAFGYRVMNQDARVIATGDTAHVCTTLTEKPKRIPGSLVTLLAPYGR